MAATLSLETPTSGVARGPAARGYTSTSRSLLAPESVHPPLSYFCHTPALPGTLPATAKCLVSLHHPAVGSSGTRATALNRSPRSIARLARFPSKRRDDPTVLNVGCTHKQSPPSRVTPARATASRWVLSGPKNPLNGPHRRLSSPKRVSSSRCRGSSTGSPRDVWSGRSSLAPGVCVNRRRIL